MIKEMRRFIERKIDQAILERSPFPHFIIENFFPDDIYADILAYNPFLRNRGQEWLSADASSNVSSRTPYHARKQINFHANMAFEASAEASRFWSELKACFLGDSWFEGLVLKKYDDYFRLRFGDLVEEPDFLGHFRKELFLQRHEPGYYIGPHTDIPTRVFTCIFSFASRPGFEEYGTELLAHRDPLVRCWGNDHYAPDEFVVKKVAPYKPNNFLLFFKTRHSFHSVKPITTELPNQRYGMQFQFYEPRQGLFRDLSMPDLMITRHQAAVTKQPPVRPEAWIAKSPTLLKRKAEPASSLAEAEKLAVSEGNRLVCKGSSPVGIHCELFDVALDGRDLGSGWFIYPLHWERLQTDKIVQPAHAL